MSKRPKPTKRPKGGRHTIELVHECDADDCVEGKFVEGDEYDDEAEYPKCTTCNGEGELKTRYLFRVLSISDFWRIRKRLPLDVALANQVAEVTRGKDAEAARAAVDSELDDGTKAEATLQTVAFAEELLVELSITPRILADSPAEIPEGCVPVRELPHLDKLRMCEELLRVAGFSKLADGSLGNSSATDAGSRS